MALLPKNEGLITAEQFLHWPDEGPCELVQGEIVHLTASRLRHGMVELSLGAALKAYSKESGRGVVASGEVGIWVRRNPDTVRGADLVFISRERYARRNPKGFLDVPPELVVEVLSPDDRYGDVMEKLREYLDLGVDLIWIVDPERRYVLAYRTLHDVERFEEGDILKDEEILPGFALPLAELFGE
jgi:Uma2 family endonuclease